MRKYLLVLLVAFFGVAQVTASAAAIIGPKDDRIPIEEALKPCPPDADPHLACGLSREQMHAILSAGMRFKCLDPVNGNWGLNAWLLRDGPTDTDEVYTNAHAFKPPARNFSREDWQRCSVSSMLDIGNERPIDPDNVRLATFDPDGGFRKDRARVGIKGGVAFGTALPIDQRRIWNLRKGDRLLSVSVEPGDMVNVTIQICELMDEPSRSKGGQSGGLATNCDTKPGNSGSLMMAFTTDARLNISNIWPVALLRSEVTQIGDYNDWNFYKNNTISVLLDDFFNKNLNYSLDDIK